MNMEFVDNGNLNYVYRISFSNNIFYLKQALPKYRKSFPGDDHLPLKEDRLVNEVRAINLLKGILDKPKFVIPTVLFFDKKNNLALFTEVKGTTLKQHLDNNIVNINDLVLAAKLIGYQHSRTIGKNIVVRPDDTEFFKKVIYFRSVLSSNALVKSEQSFIKEQYEKIMSSNFPKALINGDYSPKHLFIDGNTVSICDLEFACNGDPAYDVGFFLAHYEIENIVNPNLEIKKAIKSFLKSYFYFVDKKVIEKRLNFYIGTGILDRVDGTVRDKRLKNNLIKTLRSKAIEIINRDDKYEI